MNREDIIRMAKEADLWMTSDERIAAVERFAQLVAAAERERCAELCDSIAANSVLGTANECAAAIRKLK